MASEVVYIKGNALKEKAFEWGAQINFSGKEEDFIAEIRKHANPQGYFNFIIRKRKSVGQFGETHYLVLDSFESKKNPNEKFRTAANETNLAEGEDDGLPY